MTLREALAFLCEREIVRKDEQRIQMQLSIAYFPRTATLEGFDFAAQPSVDPKQIRELAACRWVTHGENLLFLGPPGAGKTHLAIALGRAAVMRATACSLPPPRHWWRIWPVRTRKGRLEERLAHYTKPKLLIIDELGYLPLTPNAAHLVFQLVSRRYERGSPLITSNRTVSE